jgi:HD-GYP domain-containing protein (c-di-GMP phosphodiesterase class II)
MGTSKSEMVAESGFIPVSVATLAPETSLGIALFLKEEGHSEMSLYRGPDVDLAAADLEKLLCRGQTQLFVRAYEHGVYQEYLRENLETVISAEQLPIERRFGVLNEVVRDVLAQKFATGKTDVVVDECQDLARSTVELICREDVVEADLLGVMYHDYHTFTHSANVSYYCVMLAKELSISDPQTLREIAVGALLHDLGKLEISPEILCKNGKLDEREYNVIKAHPASGFTKLCHRNDLSFGQMMMVYQHHERLDGKGYPVGIAADEIHDWAQICSVADVFEALTSNRPYRSGMSRAKAFTLMERDAGSSLDSEILKCWKATINQS